VDDEKIIHISGIPADMKRLFDDVVKFVKINVGKKLACQVSDGQPYSFFGVHNVIWRFDQIAIHIKTAVAGDDFFDQPFCFLAGNRFVDECDEYIPGNAGKKFMDIHPEAINCGIFSVDRSRRLEKFDLIAKKYGCKYSFRLLQ